MKKRTIIDLVLIFILLIVLIILGKKDYQVDNQKDKKKFDNEYSLVSKDNVFKYVDEDKVNEIIKDGNGIIFMAFNENEWSNYYAKFLNDAAKESDIEEIYYYNFFNDREKQSVEYKKIVKFLEDYLKKDDKGNLNIYAPCLIILKDGKIIFYDDETSFTNVSMKPKKYWTDEKILDKKGQFKIMFNIYLGGFNNGGEE